MYHKFIGVPSYSSRYYLCKLFTPDCNLSIVNADGAKVNFQYAWHVNNVEKLPCPRNNPAVSNSLNRSLQPTHIQISLHLQAEQVN
jgi:hypothetical protein